MAARIRKHQTSIAKPWQFYVYEVLDPIGNVIYVGKGSGRRMQASKRSRQGTDAREVARFRKESDAYAFEIGRIAELAPECNKHPGGNGSKATVKRERETAFQRAYRQWGPSVLAARMLMIVLAACKKAGIEYPGDASKVEQIRRVSYG